MTAMESRIPQIGKEKAVIGRSSGVTALQRAAGG